MPVRMSVRMFIHDLCARYVARLVSPLAVWEFVCVKQVSSRLRVDMFTGMCTGMCKDMGIHMPVRQRCHSYASPSIPISIQPVYKARL